MKLLGWMHRKFRQNGGYPSRDFTTGNPCNGLSGGPSLEEHHQYYYSPNHLKTPHRPITDQWLEAAGDPDEEEYSDPTAMAGLFHGLLTIGTLGSPGHVSDDSLAGNETPTFGDAAPSAESIAEKEDHMEATEFDLMVINSELEKVLVVPGDHDGGDRFSSVSAKQLVCPLQEYLLGSAVEMAETMEKQEQCHHRRASLAELFMKSNVEEGGGKKERLEKPAAGVQLMVKKMLKRRGGGGSTRFCSGGGDDVGGHAAASEKRFPKIMQMFHKKVHPENSVAAKKAAKYGHCMNKYCDGGRSGGGGGPGIAVADPTSTVAGRRESTSNVEFHRILPTTTSPVIGGSDSNGNREQWIKTDADYLVLEL